MDLIHRRILRVKTVGSRKTGDLRPAISDSCPLGLNYAVLEYDEPNETCVIELWCSDSGFAGEPKGKKDIESLDNHPDVLEILPSHPKSPRILGSIRVHRDRIESIQESAKTFVFKGKQFNFKKIEKTHGTDEKEHEIITVDEG